MWCVILALQSFDAVHLGVDNLSLVRHVGRLLNGHHGSAPFELVKDGDLLLLIERMPHLRGLDTVRITKVKGHADEGVVLDGRVREIDRVVTTLLMRLLTLVVEGLEMLSLMLVVTCLGSVGVGILSFLIFIGSSLPSPGQLLTMMVEMVLLQILWFGPLVLFPRGVGWFMRFLTGPCCRSTCYLGL